jgi:signal transduction histidine kinase
MSLPSAAVLLVAMLAAFATVLTGRHISTLEAAHDAAELAGDTATVVAESITSTLERARTDSSVLQQPADVVEEPPKGVAASIVTLARDSGEPMLADWGEGVVVMAVYDIVPGTVQERRDHLVGYRIVPLGLTPVLERLRPTDGGVAVGGPDREVLALPGPTPESAVSHSVALAPARAPSWSVTVWVARPRIPVLVWLIAGALLVSGVAIAVMLANRRWRARRDRDRLAGLQRTTTTIATLAVVAQQSLDLGVVLPAITTELSTALGLRGLALTTPSAGTERAIFVWGESPDPGASTQPHEEVHPGQTLSTSLARGNRAIANLRVVAGRTLDRDDLRTISAASEVLASALSNAEAYSQQRDLVRRMRSLDELKSAFLATAAHELRTPVAAIIGYAGLLHSKWDALSPEAARTHAEKLDATARRLSALVQDLLDFSRLERESRNSAGATILDLGQTVRDVLGEQPDLAPDHQVRVRSILGLRVSGSRQAVERVLTNLVGNAAKYSPAGSDIEVLVREADGRAELVVEDNGPGIPADEREQVFSRFFRGQGDEVVRTGGFGLGLAIVTEFAASMGGRVWVAEPDGEGARFVVSYPIAAFYPDPEPGADDVET